MLISHFINLVLGTVIAPLPITNPFSTAALFLSITEGDSKEKRRKQAYKGCVYVFCMSGPGAIAVTIGLATQTKGVLDFTAIIVGILIVTVICWLVLRASTRVVDYLGTTGMNALCRIMGFLLLCVGVQFIVNGIVGIVTDPATMQKIVDAFRSVT